MKRIKKPASNWFNINSTNVDIKRVLVEFLSLILKASTLEILQFKSVIWVSLKSYAYFQWNF